MLEISFIFPPGILDERQIGKKRQTINICLRELSARRRMSIFHIVLCLALIACDLTGNCWHRVCNLIVVFFLFRSRYWRCAYFCCCHLSYDWARRIWLFFAHLFRYSRLTLIFWPCEFLLHAPTAVTHHLKRHLLIGSLTHRLIELLTHWLTRYSSQRL